MKRHIALIAFAVGILLIGGAPVSAGDSYTYSMMHLSDIQSLSEKYPQTLNYTFSYLESIKNTYNISAIIITGDLVDNGDNVSQWTNYVNARSLTTIPVYEIPGNHDLAGAGNISLFDKFVGNKTRWTALINDFIFIGIGYTEDPLNESDILFYKSFIETHPQKFTLIAAHNYVDNDLMLSALGMSIKYNLVLKPTIVMSGHAHHNGLRSIFLNNISYIEDLTDYQDNGDYSAGKLYTVSVTDGDVSKIAIQNMTIFPSPSLDQEKIVYGISGTSNPSPWQVPDERFTNTSPIITPVIPMFRLIDENEDKAFPDSFIDDDTDRFVNTSPIIAPVMTVFHLADTIEDKAFPDPFIDCDNDRFVNTSPIIAHVMMAFYLADTIEDRGFPDSFIRL